MAQRVAQLSTCVKGPRSLRRVMARDAAWKRELCKQPMHSFFVLLTVRIKLGVTAFKVGIGDHARAAVPRAADRNRVEIVFLDNATQVHTNKIQLWSRSPMP